MNKSKTINISGTAKLSVAGQQLLAKYMYQKGKEFVGAALLLNQKGGYTHVYTHLILQGVELIFKAQLLLKDYKKFKPLLKKFGHNLISLVDAWKAELNRNTINSKFLDEIKNLNEYYKNHSLRYGSNVDILIHPESVKTKETLKQLIRIIKKTDNKLR